MISCPSCRASNDDAARFCSACGTALAQVCPSCGAAAPARARFCSECGSQLGADNAGPLEERRWLSILFADLAGFTQRSDQADPEDVRGILVPFHALAKDEIERFGGTLDKFIGDAAMGVFGAPVAHEDDAERAVRAALSICERVTARGMPVRIAVNTGEALVTFGEGPQVGERVAGDVVNTASRLQGHAPEGEVVVGETTHRATRGVIAYRELPAVTVKGKAEPLAMWLATSIQPTVPERDEDDPPPFVGRDRERRQLHDLMEHAVESRRPHMATVVGEPGIGKTRLVSDLGEHMRAEGGNILFHRGRCLPYGESITFTALEEIVRALIGVGPGQDRRSVAEALERTLEELEPRSTERGWLSSRLAPLVGTSSPDDAPADRS
ncbi:MAG: AAA family ATPase, partial [Myxococcota bacterium]